MTLFLILILWILLCLLIPQVCEFLLTFIAIVMALPIIIVLFPFYIILIGVKNRNNRTTGFL